VSSTLTIAPASSAPAAFSRTTARRAIKWSVRVLRSRKTMALVFDCEVDTISVKSRSQVSTMEALIAKVHGVVSVLVQPMHHARAHTHVDKKAHGLLGRMNLFRREPGRVLQGLADVLLLEIRMVPKNLRSARPVRNRAYDDRDGNTHPADARAASENVRLERDAVEHNGRIHCSRPVDPPRRRDIGHPRAAHRYTSRTGAPVTPRFFASFYTSSTCCGISRCPGHRFASKSGPLPEPFPTEEPDGGNLLVRIREGPGWSSTPAGATRQGRVMSRHALLWLLADRILICSIGGSACGACVAAAVVTHP